MEAKKPKLRKKKKREERIFYSHLTCWPNSPQSQPEGRNTWLARPRGTRKADTEKERHREWRRLKEGARRERGRQGTEVREREEGGMEAVTEEERDTENGGEKNEGGF
ncbi:hypothetical protein Pcinc_040757 [Petrolisthes cinctipes]|uniref:Uncharacterized protein n=1 Tax=Petrolisthes cinctipes TaxID=88211 RepID=A0AAE1BKX6_PETCI|nr:hypothetical protein Pcinc_040757 [Petrolisthes cinctipes]